MPKLSAEDRARLEKAGWREIVADHPWRWQEPKTRALYRFQDALDLINVKKARNDSE